MFASPSRPPIHDLRHHCDQHPVPYEGFPKPSIGKLTVQRSSELGRYEDLSPVLRRQTVELIAKGHSPNGFGRQERRLGSD